MPYIVRRASASKAPFIIARATMRDELASLGDDASPSALARIADHKRTIGGALATYHGYRRTSSLGWAIAWGLLGLIAPITTNVVALAQGFGAKKGCP